MNLFKPHNKDAFYIGWMPEAPRAYKSFLRITVPALLVISILVAGFLVINQKGFSVGVYNRNHLTKLEGIIITNPFPAIKTYYGKDIYGNPVFKTIPLVNKGKFGVDSLLSNLEKEKKINWNNAWVKLKGTIIYANGITFIETTEEKNSFTSIELLSKEQQNNIPPPKIEELDSATLHGEIIDPKCYLGVMKPGHGKPHSDCAIRCISGGIPPLLVVKNNMGEETFFFLRGKNGEAINNKILFAVGRPVTVSGELERTDDWLVLKTDPESGIR